MRETAAGASGGSAQLTQLQLGHLVAVLSSLNCS